MNIAFWSSVSGKCATSGNMLAIGTMASLVYSLKTIFVQYDYYSKPIEEAFEGKTTSNVIRDEVSYYQIKGIDDILNKVKLCKISDKVVSDNMRNVKDTKMFYLPSSRKVRNGIDEQATVYLSKDLLQVLNSMCDISLIDNLNGKKRLSRKTLEESDVVVVNLCQGINDIESIMNDEVLRKKMVFVVGKYDDESNESLNVIRKKYNISKDEICVIPYNIRFHDAYNEGRVVEFISKCMYSKRNDSDFDFINNVYKATNMILQKAGYNEEADV